MVILPGGMPGAATLDASPIVDRVLSDAAARGAYLSAICAAPMILGKRGYLRGKQATCFPGFEEYLEGATIRRDIGVIRDGKIITAAGMGVALDFGLALVAALKGDAVAAELRATVQAPPKT
jgi:4-methyl-5(b-hydroxyethyl)-thiazole monophosphate biosynthesis